MNKNKINWVAVLTMIFLFGMISFVTNLAAPIGTIWKNQPGVEGSNVWGMMGNMMNFLAYLFMGLPAGKLILKYGYKKTTLIGVAIGFLGVFVQFLSGKLGVGATLFDLPANFFIYLLGAFISGFSVCVLNTVVNPMLTLLGGGGNRGNQFVQVGGTFNSLVGTVTPMLVGALIGTVTKSTAIVDVNPVLYIAMGVFAFTFILLTFVPFVEPEQEKTDATVKSLLKYKHLVYGVVAIFLYVGVEVGIPGTLNFYLTEHLSAKTEVVAEEVVAPETAVEETVTDAVVAAEPVAEPAAEPVTEPAAEDSVTEPTAEPATEPAAEPVAEPVTEDSVTEPVVEEQVAEESVVAEDEEGDAAAKTAGSVVALYWLLMLVGRFVSSFISGKVSSKAQLVATCAAAIVLVIAAIFTSHIEVMMPVVGVAVPLSALLLVCCGLCTSVMWGTIFNLSVEGLGKYSALASGLFMTMVVGGGVLPLVQNAVADAAGFMTSYWVIVAALAYMLWFGLFGSKVKK